MGTFQIGNSWDKSGLTNCFHIVVAWKWQSGGMCVRRARRLMSEWPSHQSAAVLWQMVRELHWLKSCKKKMETSCLRVCAKSEDHSEWSNLYHPDVSSVSVVSVWAGDDLLNRKKGKISGRRREQLATVKPPSGCFIKCSPRRIIHNPKNQIL